MGSNGMVPARIYPTARVGVRRQVAMSRVVPPCSVRRASCDARPLEPLARHAWLEALAVELRSEPANINGLEECVAGE
jgi:hypothetical protein